MNVIYQAKLLVPVDVFDGDRTQLAKGLLNATKIGFFIILNIFALMRLIFLLSLQNKVFAKTLPNNALHNDNQQRLMYGSLTTSNSNITTSNVLFF